VCAAEFAEKMMEMRRWLDHRRSRAENFEYYKLASDVIVIQLDFANEGDACVFAAEFSGETVLNCINSYLI
jgi:hypothetical protein